MGASTKLNLISIPPINKTIRLVVYSIIILLALSNPVSASTDLIVNGDFESGSLGWNGTVPLFSPGNDSATCVRLNYFSNVEGNPLFYQEFYVSDSATFKFDAKIPLLSSGLRLLKYSSSTSSYSSYFHTYDYGNFDEWRSFSFPLTSGYYRVEIVHGRGPLDAYFDNILAILPHVDSTAAINVSVSPLGEPTYHIQLKPGNDYDQDDYFFFYGVERPGWHPPLAPFTDHIINLGSGSFIASRVDSTG